MTQAELSKTKLALLQQRLRHTLANIEATESPGAPTLPQDDPDAGDSSDNNAAYLPGLWQDALRAAESARLSSPISFRS